MNGKIIKFGMVNDGREVANDREKNVCQSGTEMFINQMLDGNGRDVKMNMTTKKQKTREKFRAFVTNTRLAGYCKLVLFNSLNGRGATYFDLRFDDQGIIDFQYSAKANKFEVLKFVEQEALFEINYEQALDLLKDASAQNYKYNHRVKWLEKIKSESLETAMMRPVQEITEATKYYCADLSVRQIAHSYVKAIEHRDSSLIYDLYSSAVQHKLGNRDIYSLMRYHEFDNYDILKSKVLRMGDVDDSGKIDVMILVALNDGGKRILEAQIYLNVIKEQSGYRLHNACVLDAYLLTQESDVNPLTEKVYVSVFKVVKHAQVAAILEAENDIALTGEFTNGTCYKWFREANIIEEGLSLDNYYLAQIILTEQQLIVFSNHWLNLSKIINKIYQLITSNCPFQVKRFDTVENIYHQTIIQNKLYVSDEQYEQHYYLQGEQDQQVLSLCSMLQESQRYQYDNGDFEIFVQVGEGSIVFSFFQHVVLISCYNTTLDNIVQQKNNAIYTQINDIIEQFATVPDYQKLMGNPHIISTDTHHQSQENLKQIDKIFHLGESCISIL